MSATDVTGRLARYMVEARERKLAPDVARDARHRILDSLAAMVSGSHLKPGEMAIKYARAQGGVAEATVVTTDIRTTAINAALANAMFAHADETDDFHPATKAHPGCSVVPAALAMAEREGSSGTELLNAVTLGYDLCCRFLLALGADLVRATHRSAEGTSSTMGSVGAAAALARLDEKGMRHALSYAAQQVSGIWSWVRDAEHVEKAFDFSGMGARNGVTAAIMAQMGFTGVWDVLDGEHNVLIALSTDPKPEEMVAGLGSRYFVTETAIKPFSVGYPIQAPLDAFLQAPSRARAERRQRREHRRETAGGRRPHRQRPRHAGRQLPAHHRGGAGGGHRLVRGQPFLRADEGPESARRERARAAHRRSRSLMDPAAPRSGRVEVTLEDGRTVSHFTRHAPGTKENPMDTESVNAKARLADGAGARRRADGRRSSGG